IFTHVEYADNHEQLSHKLKALDPLAYPVVLQERVVGTGAGAFYCYNKGACVAKFAHARIREKPPSGGVSVVRESRLVDPTVDKYSQALLSKLNWHGVAMVELKIDQSDGSAYLMEINGRFWGSLQLAIDAGVDFPDILINMDKESSIYEDQKPYKIGVKSRWFWGDVDLLLLYLLKSERSLNLPQNHPGRLRAIMSILKPYTQNQYFEILRLSDIGPWLYESRKRIKTNFKI
ncbi:MAG: ATP-grasp domain-containing protein, partial [Candidatus Thiodiazotropha sp.]